MYYWLAFFVVVGNYRSHPYEYLTPQDLKLKKLFKFDILLVLRPILGLLRHPTGVFWATFKTYKI